MIEASFLVQRRLGELFGWTYSEGRHVEFLSRLEKASREWGYSVEEFSEWLSSATLTASECDRLIPFFAIGETYFYRDYKVFEYLKQYLVAGSMPRRPWRLWSAACSSGEEPYTLAMILNSPELKCKGNIVYATDLNPAALAKGRAGIYSNWSFRECAESLKTEHFKKVTLGWQVSPELQECVRFQSLNLITDILPAPAKGLELMDVVFCRNVLMYFEESQARKVIRRLRDCMRPGGLLFLSPTDAFFLDEGLFEPIPGLNSSGYRRLEDGETGTAVNRLMFDSNESECAEVVTANDWSVEANSQDLLAEFLANSAIVAEEPPSLRQQALKLRNLAFASHDRGRTSEARQHILASLQMDAWDPLSNYLAGVIHQRVNEFSLARRHFQRSLDGLQAMAPEATLEDSDFKASQLGQMVKSCLAKLRGQTA